MIKVWLKGFENDVCGETSFRSFAGVGCLSHSPTVVIMASLGPHLKHI